MCSLSGEDLKDDEQIRLQIRELTGEIEMESDPVEALKKAESKLELMENIQDRVTLRFAICSFLILQFSAFLNCISMTILTPAQVSPAPAHLLQAGLLGQLLQENGKVQGEDI